MQTEEFLGEKSATEHAREARMWAEAADREGAEGNREQAMMYSAVSTSHGLASIATALAEGHLTTETELVRWASGESDSERSSTQPAVPVKPAPAIPAPGVLVPNQRVLCVQMEGHSWPRGLAENDPPVTEFFGRVIKIDRESDLVNVRAEDAGGISGTIFQFHREQTRIVAPEGS